MSTSPDAREHRVQRPSAQPIAGVADRFRVVGSAASAEDVVRELLAAARRLLDGSAGLWLAQGAAAADQGADLGLTSEQVEAWRRRGPSLADEVLRRGTPILLEGVGAAGPGGEASPPAAPDRSLALPVRAGGTDGVLVVVDPAVSSGERVAEVSALAEFALVRASELKELARLEAASQRLRERLHDWERTVTAVEDMSNALLRREDLERALGIAAARIGVPLELQRIVGPDGGGPRDSAATTSDRPGLGTTAIPGTSAVVLRSADDPPAPEPALAAIARITGLELSRQRAIMETEMRLTDELVRSLVEGDRTQLQSVWQRAALVGLDPTRPRAIVALADGSPITRDFLDRVTDAARRRLQIGEVTTFEGTVVVLWPADGVTSPTTLTSEVDALLRELRVPGLSAGIGAICTRSEQYPDAVREALFAQRLAVDGGGNRVVCAADLGMYRLFAHVGGVPALRASVEQTLGPLLAADASDGSELTQTLRVYLQHDRRLAETARALFIHVNSLRYRVDRIARLLGVDLDDADMRFMLQLALRLAPVVGRDESTTFAPGAGRNL